MSSYGSTSGSGQKPTEKAKTEVQQKSGEVMDQARRKTDEAMGQARENAREMFDQQKGRAAESLGSVATALHKTGQNLEEQNQETLGHYAHQAADQVDRIAGQVRDRDMNEILYEVESFARREPEIFLGGAVLLGLLAARFMKSSNARRQSMRDYDPREVRHRYGYGYGSYQRYGQAAGEYTRTGYPEADYPQTGAGQSEWGTSQSSYGQTERGTQGPGRTSSGYGQSDKMTTGSGRSTETGTTTPSSGTGRLRDDDETTRG